ncbi:MAG: hypothetical protein KBD00_06145 [Candidatus Peribacteraceae bacterium]|nr:hypothetical protein [Candidatus Peribacteraceae bacterium]
MNFRKTLLSISVGLLSLSSTFFVGSVPPANASGEYVPCSIEAEAYSSAHTATLAAEATYLASEAAYRAAKNAVGTALYNLDEHYRIPQNNRAANNSNIYAPYANYAVFQELVGALENVVKDARNAANIAQATLKFDRAQWLNLIKIERQLLTAYLQCLGILPSY